MHHLNPGHSIYSTLKAAHTIPRNASYKTSINLNLTRQTLYSEFITKTFAKTFVPLSLLLRIDIQDKTRIPSRQ
jgi:hypothetical protein